MIVTERGVSCCYAALTPDEVRLCSLWTSTTHVERISNEARELSADERDPSYGECTDSRTKLNVQVTELLLALYHSREKVSNSQSSQVACLIRHTLA